MDEPDQKRPEDAAPEPSPAPRRGGAGDPFVALALSLASGILLASPFQAPALSWLHYVALLPWALMVTARRTRCAWLYFTVGCYGFIAMVFGPFSALNKVIPFWFALMLTPFMIPFALLVRRIHLRLGTPLVLLVPLAWVASEWLRMTFSIGRMALYTLGSTQYHLTRLVQIADVTGLGGVTFIVAAASGATADVLRSRRPWGLRRLWPLGLFAALVVGALLYGVYRVDHVRSAPGPRIAVVQPNEDHPRDPSKARGLFDRQVEFARTAAAPGAVDLIALPENAIDYPYEDDPYFGESVAKLAQEQQSAVLVGAFSWGPGRAFLHTSAFYFSRAGEPAGHYDKLYLIPWAEYLPFAGPISRLSPTVHRWYSGFVYSLMRSFAPGAAGKELTLFPIESEGRRYQFATPICYEISNPAFARRAAAANADFLVNITSEGFFGAPVYLHMWALSSLRAVENRIPIVRVGNNGISGFIDPLGRPRSIVRGRGAGAQYLDAGTLVDRVPLANPHGRSFYSRWGDVFTYLCIGALVALLALSFAPRRRTSASSALGMSSRP